jgi:DNA (cytosine-5)-methyltransferase 1
VAGKGRGLDGARSGLFFEFIRAITESQPRYFIWENVKGALSSSRGWDMARVQIEMAQAGYDIQWVVYNAKDFGVPQNRERIFAVGTRAGSRREVLPEPEGAGQALRFVGGSEHRKKWLDNGKKKSRNFSQGERVYSSKGISTNLNSNGGGLGAKTGLYAIDLCESDPKITDEVRTIQARYWKGYSNRKAETSGVIEARAVLTPDRAEKRQNGRRMKEPGEPGFTLTGQDRHGVAIKYGQHNPERNGNTDKDVFTLKASSTNAGVLVKEATKRGYDIATPGDSINFSVPNNQTRRGRVGRGVANTLDTASNQGTLDGYRIRRLTPTECERLMGLPDGWTARGIIDGNEVDISDTQRYKMCGNGVVTTVVKTIYDFISRTAS